jgi:hypothetical protein
LVVGSTDLPNPNKEKIKEEQKMARKKRKAGKVRVKGYTKKVGRKRVKVKGYMRKR